MAGKNPIVNLQIQKRRIVAIYSNEFKISIYNNSHGIKKEIVYDAAELFKDAADTAKSSLSVLISDMLHEFAQGFKNAMCAKNNNKDLHAFHIKSKLKDHKHSYNSLIEHLNGTIQCRFKTIRTDQIRESPIVWIGHNIL